MNRSQPHTIILASLVFIALTACGTNDATRGTQGQGTNTSITSQPAQTAPANNTAYPSDTTSTTDTTSNQTTATPCTTSLPANTTPLATPTISPIKGDTAGLPTTGNPKPTPCPS